MVCDLVAFEKGLSRGPSFAKHRVCQSRGDVMEINEIADTIAEHEAKEEKEHVGRRRVALLISALAMVLAITALGGNKTTKQLIALSIESSDTWAFFQAKTLRQAVLSLSADDAEGQLAAGHDLPAEVRLGFEARIKKYRDTATRYESEADGSGRKELMAKARHIEHEREIAEKREASFAYAEALLQIAIVLASAAVASGVRFLVKGAAAVGVIGTLLAINAFFLLVEIPL